MNNLYHYTREVIINFAQRELVFGETYDEKRKRGKYYMRPYMKPDGLWLSPEDNTEECDDSWRDYCSLELSGSTLTYKYHVKLASCANLLIISDVSGMYTFWKKYRYTEEFGHFGCLAIRWQDVAVAYQGILIAPYQWSLRLHSDFFWYNTWDCASGCIWDISAIQFITLLQGG